MIEKSSVPIYTARCNNGVDLSAVELQEHPASRATRLVDDTTRFLLVSIGKQVEDHTLRESLPLWIRSGVEINTIRYRFLGFTESQVKAGKLMFFREDHEWTVERLLASFGDLSAVYLKSGYGKYSARLGLSFSSTVESLDVPSEAAHEIPDLKAPDGSLYTDGCGLIRDSFAKKICAEHGFPPDTSVFQVRRGGIKGLLVRYPDEKFENICGTHISKHLVAYRPSMFKYEGGPTALEINKHNSPPSPASLNIQFTVLLLSLGVPLAVFARLLQDQLDLIDSILTDRDKALQYVKGDLDAGVEDGLNQSLYAMLLAQHDLSEPCVRQRLQRFQKLQYDSLRRKMNLRIADSCYLFGVVDEDGVLAADEVYINLPGRNGVLAREVMVARNPSYHPGDIRKLRAVDHPLLRHHRNCIVFSRKAARSVPDTIASGDLDGDMYFVAWEPTLLPPAEMQPLNRAPSLSASQAATSTTHGNTRQLSDMPRAAVETFMQLRYSRLLGRMANEWTRAVELTPDLANGDFPRQLVPLIESALDIMKTGDDYWRLQSDFKRLCQRYANLRLDGYASPLQTLRSMIPDVEDITPRALDCDPSLILRREDPRLWQEYINEAERVMPRYNRELSGAIKIDHESGTTEVASSSRSAPHDREPRQADRVKRDYQSRFFGGGPRAEYERQRIRASAWYYYGYSQNKGAFAWLGERYLNEIKALSSNGNKPVMYVGARNTRPSNPSPLVREESQATLVGSPSSSSQLTLKLEHDDTDMEVDPVDDVPIHKRSPASDGSRARRQRQNEPLENPETMRTRIRNRCLEARELPHVSVLDQPKPRAPVTGQYVRACSGSRAAGHDWQVTANGFSRRYVCRICGYDVREKKKDGYWEPTSAIVSERRSWGTPATPATPREDAPSPAGPRTRSQARGMRPSHPPPSGSNLLSAIQSAAEEDPPADAGGDVDSDDAMSEYESAVEELSPKMPRRPQLQPDAPRRSSAGTMNSDAPSSLAGMPYLRRLPGRPGSDVSSPIGRPRQVSSRRVSGSTTSTPTSAVGARAIVEPSPAASVSEVSPEEWPLVRENPKPAQPVVSAVPRCQAGPSHAWKVWGNAFSRHYTCRLCAFVAKERKHGTPEVWVPMH